ncbi:MAG: hypothetical protein LAT63_09235 [Marinobacter sp.]|nr:hypothetical protein [Marinobacter sp.]
MKDYLQKIRAGQPINYAAFLKALPADIARRHSQLFQTTRVSAQRWRVAILDEATFRTLEQRAITPADRVAAASQGDSHRQRNSHSFLLVYRNSTHQHRRQQEALRPDVVILSRQGAEQGFTAKPAVLVIENEENFFHYKTMLAFASDCIGRHLSLTNCDVVLGGGARISSENSLRWLAGYQAVYTAFDYDGGGLRIYASLVKALGDKVHWVQPKDWQPWRAAFRKAPKSTERFTEAVRLAEDLGFGALAAMFSSTGKFMEQEMILDD